MKHLVTCIVLLTAALFSQAQTRVSLLEEFTGETCMPCAVANPALDALLEQPANASKMIAIKWQVPIPAIPVNPVSLYQTNKPEIDWRYKGSALGAYGYPAQYSPGSNLSDGIVNAPTCFIDGKNQWTFGATSDHPYYLNNGIISTAAAVPTPFSISMSPAWNSSFTNGVVTVTVTSSSAFTAQGNLMFRLCLVERRIEFATAPGTNGERIFQDVVRQSYPTTGSGSMISGMGTLLPASWTAGQTQVLTINCTVPSYIMDKSQMAFVGFVQDDGDRQVYQTARTAQPEIPNDAKAVSVSIPLQVCTSTVAPSVVIRNNGPTAITALTISPVLDAVAGTAVTWSGNLAPLTSATLSMPVIPVSPGLHVYACTISDVSGGDMVTANNTAKLEFSGASTYVPAPLSEGFEGASFPPPGWLLPELGSSKSFEHSSSFGGYASSAQSVMYPLFYAPAGEVDELYLPPTDLLGTQNSELRFDLAYQQLGTSKDSLKVLLSSDCGNSWVTVFANGSASMATAPPASGTAFNPFSAQWTTYTVSLGSYAASPQVLIKFQVKADRGNGLFIDNINLKEGIFTPAGMHARIQQCLGMQLYPNPARANVVLAISSEKAGAALLELRTAIGQLSCSKSVQLTAGTTTIPVDCSELPAGVYFVNVTRGSDSITRKLVIAE